MDVKEEVEKEEKYFSKFVDKKVSLNFSATRDFSKFSGEKIGKVKKLNGRFVFFEGRHTRKFYFLTLGVFDGFFATLTVKQLKEL
jgi:hypothetical protein